MLTIERPDLLPAEFRVFYSWQSQLHRAGNFNFIAASIRAAISKVEAELPDDVSCAISIDRDTTGRVGTPEIAATILEKVSQCHLFVGDVSIVHDDGSRCYSNNNVLIELGFAAGKLGWDRVACVCNTAYGPVESLPFDIRGRRILKYQLEKGGDKKTAASQLDKQLSVAIGSLLEAMGRGDIAVVQAPDDVKRKRDVQILRHVLENIHRPTFDRFFDGLREYKFLRDFHFYWDGLAPVVNSNRFQFYDQKLHDLVLAFCVPLGEGIAEGAHVFGSGNNPAFFTLRHHVDGTGTEGVEQVLEKLFESQAKLQEFLDYVHSNYPEIDLNETDRAAWEENEPYITGSILESRQAEARGDADEEAE